MEYLHSQATTYDEHKSIMQFVSLVVVVMSRWMKSEKSPGCQSREACPGLTIPPWPYFATGRYVVPKITNTTMQACHTGVHWEYFT